MSSINLHPTFHYSQPEDYRFSHDSVFLARWAAEKIAQQGGLTSEQKVLDLCSGTGVIGLDLAFHLCHEFNQDPRQLWMDFVEIQAPCYSHFRKNLNQLSKEMSFDFSAQFKLIEKNYALLLEQQALASSYASIVCNPPYFNANQGKLSPSEFKNRSRFFLDSDLPTLIAFICYSLKPNGRAYVLLKNLSDHGQDTITEARTALSASCSLELATKIRGTDVVEICKN